MDNNENVVYSAMMPEYVDLWNRAVNKNDHEAQYKLGLFFKGLHNKEADEKAFLYLQKAAGSVTEAMYELGICYEQGIGTRKNAQKASDTFKSIGFMVREDVSKDPFDMAFTEALMFVLEFGRNCDELAEVVEENKGKKKRKFSDDEKEALAGDSEAQYRLGNRYNYAEGVGFDKEKAIYWYTKSAEQDNEHAIHTLAIIYDKKRRYVDSAHWYKKYAEAQMRWRDRVLSNHTRGVLLDELQFFPTSALVAELSKREGVEAMAIEPYKEYSITVGEDEMHDSGPAVLIKIID